MRTHELKVLPPYFDALVSGAKTFEVRLNDRGYQRGDVLRLREWHPADSRRAPYCSVDGCSGYDSEHWATPQETVLREVTFVYSGDGRIGGLAPGFVVLALGPVL